LSGHTLPWILVSSVWIALFYPNMMRKDMRLSRHPGWEKYLQKSNLLIPRLEGIIKASPALLRPNSNAFDSQPVNSDLKAGKRA